MHAVLWYRVLIAVSDSEEELLVKKQILDEEVTPLIKERMGWISAVAEVTKEN